MIHKQAKFQRDYYNNEESIRSCNSGYTHKCPKQLLVWFSVSKIDNISAVYNGSSTSGRKMAEDDRC